ncbi:transglycosylase domain-containing protein [Uliginosibacterium sp. 31-16]|uniref:penicillin-binding protein 1A n=1 Tax=Uliginosibacterium sp. 31-16 TaxID=3068315 RepID=UPI00273D8F0B|nr:transglycosylase domain-containing protein [Uliginosibacterium sp. 31-16]MDP5239649.1 transglycosylase domain-containing protein [Uliginosibacterium sp. 31-16]
MPLPLPKPDWSALTSKLKALLQRLRHPGWREILGLLAVPPALLLLWTLLLIPFTPGISDIRKARDESPTRVLTLDGKELATFKRGNRDWVALDAISPRVIDALIATEDKRFYTHHGIDFYRLGGAVLATLQGDTQGGSTITQQLARNLFPEDIGRRQNLNRKLKEAITALKIEALYSKRQILETYLNTVPFLYNAYGIDMAARTYFGKPARELDLLESATLIGMLKGTAYYNPVQNPERARERRNLVLSLMAQQDKLSAARYEALAKRPLKLDFERQSVEPGEAPHFTAQLKRWLIDWADQNDYDIYTDGLVVVTTLDSRLQKYATRAVEQRGRQLQGIANGAWAGQWHAGNHLVEALIRESKEFSEAVQAGEAPEAAMKRLTRDATFLRQLREDKTRVQAGFLAIDPRDGAVRAWVGSRDYTDDAWDHVHQARRQPGSTFKPFVYGAAFAQGMKPDDTFPDAPVEIPLGGNEVWRPDDGEPPTNEPMTLATALALSRNRITAQVMQQVGPVRVARLARAMGVRESKLDEVPSLALGTSPVTLYEMVSAYATIADEGRYRAPYMVARIENRKGEVLAEFQPNEPERALAAAPLDTLLDAMRGVVQRGTGAGIRAWGVKGDLAAKTGTTQGNTDGWFILMHPQLIGGAWVGFNDARITLRSDYWGQGAHSALPIVGDVFARAQGVRFIDTDARFARAVDDTLLGRLNNWYDSLFGDKEAPDAAASGPRGLAAPAASAPQAEASVPASAPAAEASAPAEPTAPISAPAPASSAPAPAASAPATAPNPAASPAL